jgi:hypothetical protein
MDVRERCATCNGTGARVSMTGVQPDDPKPYACPDCGGTGKSQAALAEQLRGAVDAGDTFKVAVIDALRMSKGDEMAERIWTAVEEYNLATGGGQSNLSDDLAAIHEAAARIDPSIDPLVEVAERRAALPRFGLCSPDANSTEPNKETR